VVHSLACTSDVVHSLACACTRWIKWRQWGRAACGDRLNVATDCDSGVVLNVATDCDPTVGSSCIMSSKQPQVVPRCGLEGSYAVQCSAHDHVLQCVAVCCSAVHMIMWSTALHKSLLVHMLPPLAVGHVACCPAAIPPLALLCPSVAFLARTCAHVQLQP